MSQKRKRLWILTLICVAVIGISGCAGITKPEPTPLPTVSLAPVITAPPSPTPTPKPSIGPYYEPTVTKSPGAEDRVEGSCIYFSAFATDALRCEWELINKDRTLDWEKIDETFEGMVAAGIHDNYLILGNIPLSLDGWSVRCKFIGSGDATVYSSSALISVRERTVKIHGEERSTVKGTGNLSGYGAVIDYGEESWWTAEEYAGATFSLQPYNIDYELGVENVSFAVTEDGSVSLTVGEKEYTGFLSTERIGGFTPSAGLLGTDSDAEVTVFFDYTEYSERWETWEEIFLEFPAKELPIEEAPDAVADAKAYTEAEAEESTDETVTFILTRVIPD